MHRNICSELFNWMWLLTAWFVLTNSLKIWKLGIWDALLFFWPLHLNVKHSHVVRIIFFKKKTSLVQNEVRNLPLNNFCSSGWWNVCFSIHWWLAPARAFPTIPWGCREDLCEPAYLTDSTSVTKALTLELRFIQSILALALVSHCYCLSVLTGWPSAKRVSLWSEKPLHWYFGLEVKQAPSEQHVWAAIHNSVFHVLSGMCFSFFSFSCPMETLPVL